VFLANALIDKAYYGEWTFPPLTFLKFNVVHSLSVFYGRNDWHYYLSQGLPLLLTSFLPLALYALYRSLLVGRASSPAFQIAITIVGAISTYSLIAHKEVRFLYPLLPLLHVLSAKTFQDLSWSTKTKNRILAGMILLNLPVAYYTSMVHQRGVIDVMTHLGVTSNEWNSAGFLMPCHSTPWKSALGGALDMKDMWALTCEPPIDMEPEARAAYVDEADQFYADPKAFAEKFVGDGKRYEWPERLAVFEALVKEDGGRSLWDGRYEECWRGFNTHWHDDDRRKGDVVVFCLRDEMDGKEPVATVTSGVF